MDRGVTGYFAKIIDRLSSIYVLTAQQHVECASQTELDWWIMGESLNLL